MIKNVYIHIPFCNNICTYCDFCKMYYNKKWINDYLNSLENEINNNYKNEIVETVYIGGGTPSSLSILELEKLFGITEKIQLSNNYEFTIECNIEDITEEKLKLFKDNKINRISIGIQTFNDKYLKYLGRCYNSNLINDKILLAKKYFKNINIDLMYAFNNQTIEELNEDIDKFISLDIPHISCYSLIIEDNTILKNNNTKPISEELDRKMYDLINQRLKNKYNHYEISNYSKKGYESKHNLCYWDNKKYYGFGLGASSYTNNIRYNNTRNLTDYLKGKYIKDKEVLTINDIIKYELIVGFRKIKGINKSEFYKKYNVDIKDIYNIKELLAKEYLLENKEYIFINEKYIYVSNEILINFV